MRKLTAEPVVKKIYEGLKLEIAEFEKKSGRKPKLATVLVGHDQGSEIYVSKKAKTSLELGFGHSDIKLSEVTTEKELITALSKLNADDTVDGILIQSPLPKQINAQKVFDLIDPQKDVDCFSPYNVGLLMQGRAQIKPCTPAGVIELLKHYQVTLAGKNALVVGRSDIVGKPMAQLLLQENATVTTAHSKTKDMNEHLRHADIVVAAIGKPLFLNGSYSWKKDAVVIDVGINRILDSKKVVGDVDYTAVFPNVSAITPVPGGIGPMTIAMLMKNTLIAAKMRAFKR